MPFVSKFSRGRIKPEELNRIVSDLRGIQNGMQEIRVKSATVMTDAKVHGNADIDGAITNNGTPVDNRTVSDGRYALKNGDATQDFSSKINTSDQLLLAAIDRVVASSANIVDVFLYDTTKDSDGGAWRKRCQALSWYNEPLNTAARGKTREFPALALIVAETTRVTIYDATQPDLPMFIVFNMGTAYLSNSGTVSSVAMVNGFLLVGMTARLVVTNFIGDRNTNYNSFGRYSFSAPVSLRNNSNYTFLDPTKPIVSSTVNDVSATILPGAPIDPATGLPVPTVAVATAGGASVIKNDGTVANITGTYSGIVVSSGVHWVTLDGTYIGLGVYVHTSPADALLTFKVSDLALVGIYTDSRTPGRNLSLVPSTGSANAAQSGVRVGSNEYVAGSYDSGMTHISENPTSPSNGMVAYVTKDYFSGYLPGDIRRAWLADGTAGTVTGSEGANLVTNGTFDTDISGWTPVVVNLASITHNSGQLRITGTAGFGGREGYAHQQLTLDPNKHYVVRVSALVAMFVTTPSGTATVKLGTTVNGSELGSQAVTRNGRVLTFLLKPTQASVYLTLHGQLDFDGGDVAFDNVEVREVTVDADRSVKNRPLIPYGTLTKAPVATGAELMGYSGFSTTNYLEEPYSADLDFGTGDFAIFGWLKENPNTTNEAIFCRAAYSGSAFTGGGFMQAYVDPGGKIVFSVSDDSAATFDTVATPGPVDDGIFRLVCCIVRSGKIELWVDAAKITEGPIANANLGVSNSNASMRFGYRPGGSLPLTNGTLALWRTAAYAPTPDQIRAIYEAEKHLFVDNAKALLGGTSNAVRALAHDPDTDLLYAGTADGVSVFQGLRRVSYLKGAPMTSANIKAIGAARGAVLIGTGAEASYAAPELILREATPPNLRDGSADLNVREVTEGGVKLGDKYLAKQAVQTGSFNAVFKGFTADVTVLATWTKISDVVTISLPMVNGSSNAGSMYLAGTSIPAELRPSAAGILVPVVVATPSYEAGYISVSNSGNWDVGRFGGVFSTSGSKGMPPICFTYKL